MKNSETLHLDTKKTRKNTDNSEPLMDFAVKLQNELHKILYLYLNGFTMAKISILFFPFINRMKSLKNYFENLEEIFSEIYAKFNFERARELYNLLISNRNNTSSLAWSELISKSYVFLEFILKKINKETQAKSIVIKEIDLKKYSNKTSTPIKKLNNFVNRYLKDYLSGFYIHGSLATLDYTNYSDLDTLAIIKKDVLSKPAQLLRLQRLFYCSTRYLYYLDPLQHHGHMVSSEYDLDFYPQLYLPLKTFDYSVSLLRGGENLLVIERNSSNEIIQTVTNTVENLLQASRSRPKNIFYSKFLLSNIMLTPAIFLMTKGRHNYKKFSFDKIKEFIPTESLRVLNTATEIRSRWDVKKNSFIFRGLLELNLSPLLLVALNNKLAGRVPRRISELMDEGFYEDLKRFALALKESLNCGTNYAGN